MTAGNNASRAFKDRVRICASEAEAVDRGTLRTTDLLWIRGQRNLKTVSLEPLKVSEEI